MFVEVDFSANGSGVVACFGGEDIGQESQQRRLFWRRLAPTRYPSRPMLFATAHYTWRGAGTEVESGVNLRRAEAKRTLHALNRLQQEQGGGACFFGGDLNESFWPRRVLHTGGFQDCFRSLHLPAAPTHPARPCVAREENNADCCLDWLFARGWSSNPGPFSSASSPREKSSAEQPPTRTDDCSVRPILSSVIKDMIGLSSVRAHMHTPGPFFFRVFCRTVFPS